MAQTKQKVSGLPIQEQEKLIAQLKELKIRGVYSTWTVELAKKKIADALAKNGSNPPKDEQLNEDQEDETQEGESQEDEDQEDEPEDESDDEDQEDEPEDESDDEDQEDEPEVKVETSKKEGKPLICHICRSRVIKGKCNGCGFELRV